MKVRLGIFAVLILSLAGCQPNRREADFSATQPSGVTYVHPKEAETEREFALSENKVIGTPALYRLAENLTVLEKQYPQLSILVSTLNARVRTLSTRPVDAEVSAYADLVIANAVPKVKDAVQGLQGQIQKDYQHIDVTIGGQTPVIPVNATVRELGDILVKSLKKFAADLKTKPISDLVRVRLVAEVTQLAAQYEDFFSKLDTALANRSSLTNHLRSLTQVLKDSKMDFSLDGIDQAEHLGSSIDQISDAQAALRTLIEVWKYMSDADRQSIIGKLNPDLYTYLKKQDESDLRCLAKSGCGDLFKAIAKDFALFPAIEKYGVAKIKTELNNKAIEYVDARVQREISTTLSNFPSVLFAKVHSRIDDNIAQLGQFQKSFGPEFKKRLRAYAAKDFAPVPVLASFPSAGKVRLTIAESKLTVGPLTNPEVNEANDGAWLGYAAEVLKSKRQAITGVVRQTLMSAIEWNAGRFSASTKVIPQTAAVAKPPQFDARAEAEKVRGLSLLSGYIAPWRDSSYNQVLGQVTMGRLFPEYPADMLSQSIFPNESVLPLVLSSVSTTMKKLQQNPSPLLLIDSDRKIVPLSSNDDTQLPVMSVLVDVKNGVGTTQVETATIATSILAYSEFLLATEGLDKANLPLLKTRDEKGSSPGEELEAGRVQIRKLVFALCNFLSNPARHPEGLIAHQVTVPGYQLSPAAAVTIEDQALAIRAFAKASLALKNDIYRWEAIALVNRLNSNYLNSEKGFYDLKTGSAASLTEIVEMIVALEELKVQLPEDNKQSISLLQKPILAALGRVK